MKSEPKLEIDEKGNKHWHLNGKLHREDGPALEFFNGTKFWYLNGLFHREDGPAIEHPSGIKHWFLNGNRHRADGPAIEYPDGIKIWFLNGFKFTFTGWLDQMGFNNRERMYYMLKYGQ